MQQISTPILSTRFRPVQSNDTQLEQLLAQLNAVPSCNKLQRERR